MNYTCVICHDVFVNTRVERSVQKTVRWGILATGHIAESFARDLELTPGHRLAAVGSRTAGAAQHFVDDFADDDGARTHASYEALAADPDLDVIYVATPHSRHVQDVMTCFEAGQSVLCEKALAMNATDTAWLVAEARRRGLFFAEAMWMRTNPAIRRARDMVLAGACGQVGMLRAELGFAAPASKTRLWDPAVGASALLDVGIYPLTFAHLMLGEPTKIVAAGTLSDANIDIAGGATLTYANGAVATIGWSQVACTGDSAAVAGDDGRIDVPARFHHPDEFTHTHDEVVRTISAPRSGRGYVHEIEEVGRCLAAGLTESEHLPLDETVAIMAQIDQILAQIGVPPR